MADIAAVSPSVDAVTAQFAPHITGLSAGEELDPCSACYISETDNLVYMYDGTAGQVFAGICPRLAGVGQPVTLYQSGVRLRYAADLTPGTLVFLSATAGALADAGAANIDTTGVGIAIDAQDIIITRVGQLGAVV